MTFSAFKHLMIAFVSCMSINTLMGQSDGQIPITSNHKEAISHYWVADSLENLRDLEGAERAYRAALDLDSTFAMAYLRLGMLRDNYDLRRESVANAMKYLNKVSVGERLWIQGRHAFYGNGGDDSKEFGLFKTLVETYPKDSRAQYLFGYMNLHHGRSNVESGILHLKEAVMLNPNLTAAHNELAYAYMQNGYFKEADQIIIDYIKLLPNHADPYDTQAELKLRMGRYAESIKAYDKVLSINPTYPWAYIGKAANLDFLDRQKEARILLEKLHSFELSDYEKWHKWRAIQCSYIDEGDVESALDNLVEQNDRARNNGDFQQAYQSYSRYVHLCFQIGQPSRGMEMYEKWSTYITEHSKSETTRKNVRDYRLYFEAQVAFQANNLEQALEKLTKYNAESGRVSADSKILRSNIYLKKEEFTEARKILETLDLEKDAYHMFHLAELYRKTGMNAKAQVLYKRIRDLYDLRDINYALIRREALKEIND